MYYYTMDKNGVYEVYMPDDEVGALLEWIYSEPNNQRKYRGKKVLRWRKMIRIMKNTWRDTQKIEG